jgi:hypothetical protein
VFLAAEKVPVKIPAAFPFLKITFDFVLVSLLIEYHKSILEFVPDRLLKQLFDFFGEFL